MKTLLMCLVFLAIMIYITLEPSNTNKAEFILKENYQYGQTYYLASDPKKNGDCVTFDAYNGTSTSNYTVCGSYTISKNPYKN